MKKILVANRGEIALRIMKTAKKMGISTVAIYSDIDRNSPHVHYADEAIRIGENASNQSYLKGSQIITEAVKLGVDAIHPGYGFLSENADFAEEIELHDLIFIGPKSTSIRTMGDKLAAKKAVKKYQIPMVPGSDFAIQNVEKALSLAKEIGFPLLIKAAAGGGGKGMRIVNKAEELPEQFERAVSEALSAFGDGSVFIEKYIDSPRHIEIQVLADQHGKVLHLFERECSIQRRHQKVVEEAPSSILTEEIRNKIGAAAIQVAKSCNYLGAGTVEFIMDKDMNFYFLEMNTRLQVEHPVTEFITGIDLVEEQINIARGNRISLDQKDLRITGHAIELRVYAEDPLNNFTPNIGVLESYKIPSGNNIRVDDGFREGMSIPIYYDPMISKLITYGSSRMEAIQLMIKAIDSYKIEGVLTTLPFGKFVCEHESFRSGNFDTHFIDDFYSPDKLEKETDEMDEIAALIGLKFYMADQKILRIAND